MESGQQLLIFGSSTRAAAFSALRANLTPWCVDLFADVDLQARCPVLRMARDRYPAGFVEASERGPAGPWIYTGGLENHPRLLSKIARRRVLWGNEPRVFQVVRDPQRVLELLRDAGLPCPEARLPAGNLPQTGRWLVKPWAGAGGSGIGFWKGGPVSSGFGRRVYLQEFLEGDAYCAVYVGDERRAWLLGVTRQLVGEPWLHARPFRYCGSIGPVAVPPGRQAARGTLAVSTGKGVARGTPALDALGATARATGGLGATGGLSASGARHRLDRLGDVLVAGGGLRGLFGVDFILRDEIAWPVEINPRYTASVELLEYGLRLSALALHQHVFDPAGPGARTDAMGHDGPTLGKAIFFARAALTFPADGLWASVLHRSGPIWDMPAFADIPPAGQRIRAGRPVLTFFARGCSVTDCREQLRQIAADLDHWLYGR